MPPRASADDSVEARALANSGRLDEALAACARWIAADRMSAAAHYLRGMILQEQGEAEEARASLRRAVYLEPRFVLAHYALGNLARGLGRSAEAGRHFANVLELLNAYRAGDPLPESEGLTAGRLAEAINAIRHPGGPTR